MKRITKQWLVCLLLPLLSACQNDEVPTDNTPDYAPLTVKATIGTEPESRAQVQYGNENEDLGEIFMWNNGDTFKVYDCTDGSATGTTFTISDGYDEANPSASADFTCPPGTTYTPGHTLLAFYCNVTPTTDADGNLVFTYQRPADLTQTQTATPGHADLAHLKDALWMAALSTADAQGKPGPFDFGHFSSLIRITVTNTSGADKKIKSIECSYGVNNFVVVDKMDILIDENGKASYPMNDVTPAAKSTINLRGADGNGYATIAQGTSYDIFIPEIFYPMSEIENVMITLTDENDARQTVDIAGLEGKNVTLDPGMRYWFDLTITADGLRQTFREPYAWYTADKGAATFTLRSAAELREFARLVNGEQEALTATGNTKAFNFSGKTVRIADGITTLDLSGKEWTPIGTSSTTFNGTFDGNGATVSGLNVNVASGDYVGFFGALTHATISNLHVKGSITAKNSQYVGGIAGFAGGSSVIENCLFAGTVEGKSEVGGIAGYNNASRITACFSSGSVGATDRYAGGIVGDNIATVTHCYSSATVTAVNDIAGGITGSHSYTFTISSCYATGTVSAESSAGGIAGVNGVRSTTTTITNCFALGTAVSRTSGNSISFGRVVGTKTSSATLTNCAAYAAMTLPSGITATSDPGSKHGKDLDRTGCLTTATYTGFDTSFWAFDTKSTWEYLPWNQKLYEYWGDAARIMVPKHLLPN